MLAKNGLDNGAHFKLHSVKYGGKSTKVNFFDKNNSSELFELVMNDSDNLATFFTQNGNQ